MAQPKSREVRIAILAFDDCMSSAVVGMLDAFHLANRWSATVASGRTTLFEMQILAAKRRVAGSAGFKFDSQRLDDSHRPQIAIVPPIAGPVQETLTANCSVVTWIARYAASGGVVASVCGGIFFLAHAGLLAGRTATTNPMFASALLRAHPDTRLQLERRVVDDGRVLTAGSTTAFLDLSIHVIDRFAGHQAAVMTAKALSVDKNHRSQLPYFLPFADKGHGDSVVLELQTWLEENFARTLGAERMARHAALSQRSLNRRFRAATGNSPMEYLHRLRIEAAKRHLETSDLGVQEITARVGYQDPRSFSRLFRAGTGLSPREYRERFGAALDADL